MSKRPTLLLYKDLIMPLDKSKNSLKEMISKIEEGGSDKVLLESFVVFSISRFESMLANIMTYFLNKVPYKISSKEIKLLKEEVISDNPLSLFIEREINTVMYGSVDKILSYFCSVLSINVDIDKNKMNRFYEFKESRNLLIHNDSIVNTRYLDKCVNFKREIRPGIKLTFEEEYVVESISNMLDIITKIEIELSGKYSHYSEIRAFRELWNYVFSSPLLKFDDYWHVDTESNELRMKEPKYKFNISSSEKMYLGMWYVHFNGDANLLNGFNMHSITEKSKMYFLLETLGDLYLGG